MATGIFRHNFPQVDELQKKADEADFVIGLDLHKKTTAITVVDVNRQEKPVFQRKRLKNSELMEVLLRFQGKKMIIAEAAYGWFPLRRAFEGIRDITFVLFDPRKTSAWIKTSGIKNDRIDSEVLAYSCLKGGLPALAVYMPDELYRSRFKLVSFRDHLVSQRTRVKNQLKAIERDYGVNTYTGEVIDLPDEAVFMRDLLEGQLEDLNHRVQETEKKIAKVSQGDPAVALLRSVPHIGPITAFALRCKMENVKRFQSAKHLCSYFGFGIRQRQSGDGNFTGKLTKQGNSLIRKLLIQGAQGLRSNYPDYPQLYFPQLGRPGQTQNRKHANKLAAAIARKHLTFVYYAWKNARPFEIKVYRELRREQQRQQQEFTESKNPRPLNGKEGDAGFKTADPDYALGSNAVLTV